MVNPCKLLGVIVSKNTVRTCVEHGEFSGFCREVISYFGLSPPLVFAIISLRFGSRLRFRRQVPYKRGIWKGFHSFYAAFQANATIVP